jgi:hypothetical protein
MRFNDYTSFINEALYISEVRPYIEEWEKHGGRKRYSEWFDGKWRIYMSINGGKSDIFYEVEEVLTENGYYIVDYSANKAGKEGDDRPFSIGKLLNRFGKHLITDYAKDKDVLTADENHIIVISRHPYDIAGMTTDRRWNSCMDIRGGSYMEHVMDDVREGTLVAYVIKKEDTNIQNPLNRVLIKKYVNDEDDDDNMLGVEDSVYVAIGSKTFNGFVETVEEWLAEKQGEVESEYTLHHTLYDDGKYTLEPTNKILRKLSKRFGTAFLADNGKCYIIRDKKLLKGIADLSGKVVLKPTFKMLIDNDDNFLIGNDIDDNYSLLDLTGKIILSDYYLIDSTPFKDTFLVDKDGDSVALFRDGKHISKEYHRANIADGFMFVGDKHGKNKGVVDCQTGEEILIGYDEFEALGTSYFSPLSGVYKAVKNDKKGVFKIKDGKIEFLVPLNYDNVYLSKHNFNIILLKDGKYGAYEVKSGTTIEAKYDDLAYGDNHTFKYKKSDGEVGIYLIPSKLEAIYYQNHFYGSGYRFEKNGKYGGYDVNYNLMFDAVVPFEYDCISVKRDKYIIAYKGDESTVFDFNGKVLFPTVTYKPHIRSTDADWVITYPNPTKNGEYIYYDLKSKKDITYEEYQQKKK